MSEAERALSRTIARLLVDHPFFGHLLAGVVRRVTRDVPTLGVRVVGGRPELAVHPDYFLALDPRVRVGAVQHEALHLALHHAARRSEDRDPERWDIAVDLVVNQLVDYPLPPGAVTLSQFRHLGLRPNRSAEHYYQAIVGEPSDEDEGQGEPRHSDHTGWATDDGVQARAAAATLEALVARTADRVGAGAIGSLPGPLRRAVEATLERRRPRIDWRRVVRLFAASSRRTRIGATLRRPSKRYGTYPGLQVRRLSRIAAVVDTSGSVDERALALFFSEVHGLWRRGADVEVLECDATVQRRYGYRGRPPEPIGGGGGTAFDPAFAELRRDRHARWDGCVVLTDGEAPPPKRPPPCPVLYVVTPDGRLGAHLRFGRAVRLAP